MDRNLRHLLIAIASWLANAAAVQSQSLGPTTTETAAATVAWPASPPKRICVLPFTIDPALQEELRQQASSSLVPQGPVRQMIASRPRLTDIVTGYDRSEQPGVGVSRLADEIAGAIAEAVNARAAGQRR